ncbi:MAG TPA: hypothetical protein VLF67_05445 [Candidatus Saccharimonas sp.]|nr:hypothetical protein [Candidatus Saccharimonas sp.]
MDTMTAPARLGTVYISQPPLTGRQRLAGTWYRLRSYLLMTCLTGLVTGSLLAIPLTLLAWTSFRMLLPGM